MPQNNSPHDFYIPVMGTGFTIDSPLFVAKYGISSVISLVDDVLIEQMRKFWCEKSGEPYEPINSQDKDARAKRITAYLNLMQKIIDQQIADIKASPFEPNSEITRYFEMLPKNQLKQKYSDMLVEHDSAKKLNLQEQLRQAVTVGSIDVNIMTKLDCQNYYNGEALPYEFNDAAAALRGYANSDLDSTVVFSAGFNPHLYGYISEFNDFYPDANGYIKKKICLKVSDYRSAAVQGKYLAKRGLWVSEYRIESALNCGGHAFINDGQLLGPILAEFKQYKNELIETLHGFYKGALEKIKKLCPANPQKVKITAQGGVGTSVEHELLIKHYDADAVGWGTPFLLVPGATSVDVPTLDKLINAQEKDVFLSASSPLGIPFWNLKNSESEEARCERIKNGAPGSFCAKGYLKFNQEFTKKPICRASREYQKLKLQELESSNLPSEQLNAIKEDMLSKACICHELGGGVLIKDNIDTKIKSAICPGPNLINFKKIATLKEMIDHIYGRCSLIANNERPHVFIREIQLQINHLLNEMKNASAGLPARSQQKLAEVKQTLSEGIEYYKKSARELFQEQQNKCLLSLQELQDELPLL
ncbi:MAG: hypothetical protein ACD_21C00268G0004 [uncultured bacterium]|nr:MAG: hypothetical protein ACD_21C00268G0004 [uncultured bacterium]